MLLLTRLTADAASARPHRSSQAYLCPAAHHSTLIHSNAETVPTTKYKRTLIDVVCRRRRFRICAKKTKTKRAASNFCCVKKKSHLEYKNDRLRQRVAESDKLFALLFQVWVGFRKIRHFYFVINSVSLPG